MIYPVTIPPTPNGYDIGQNVRGSFGGYYNGAHYLFVVQGALGSTPPGDYKLHALKSADNGATWTEPDAAHALTLSPSPGFGQAYTVSRPDAGTVWVIYLRMNSTLPLTQASIDGLTVTSYDLATDTWSATVTDYDAPMPGPWYASAGSFIVGMNLAIRGAADYQFYFSGALETVAGARYGRVYAAAFDGAAFGAPVMLPGQTGNPSNYTPTTAKVDSEGTTHFFYCDDTNSVYHVGRDRTGTFGAVSRLTAHFDYPPVDPGYLSDPDISVVDGIETIALALSTSDPVTFVQTLTFFSATAALNPLWTAGTAITSNPAIVPNITSLLFEANTAVGFTGGIYFVVWLNSVESRWPFPIGLQPGNGTVNYSASDDRGRTWSAPVTWWSAPAAASGNLLFAAQQIVAYPSPAGIAVLAMFQDAGDAVGGGPPSPAATAEIAMFGILAPTIPPARTFLTSRNTWGPLPQGIHPAAPPAGTTAFQAAAFQTTAFE